MLPAHTSFSLEIKKLEFEAEVGLVFPATALIHLQVPEKDKPVLVLMAYLEAREQVHIKGFSDSFQCPVLLWLLSVKYSDNHSSLPSRRSGLSLRVRSRDCSCFHWSIFAACPESKISGTFQPLYSAGRVYTGGASKPS